MPVSRQKTPHDMLLHILVQLHGLICPEELVTVFATGKAAWPEAITLPADAAEWLCESSLHC